MLVYLGSLVFSAIVAPLVYHAIQFLYGYFPETLNYLAHKEFVDYFDRLRWVPVVLCLPWLFIKTQLFSWKKLGVVFDDGWKSTYARWWLIGAALLIIVAVAQIMGSDSSLKADLATGKVIKIILMAIAGGLALGFLEEILFRGLILRMFYSATGPILAIILASAFFSSMHFKMPDQVWIESFPIAEETMTALQTENVPEDSLRVDWKSGFFVAYWTFLGVFADFQPVKFMTLFFLGSLLCLITLQRKTLIAAMGIHAGIVTLMLSYGKLGEIHTEASPYHAWLGGRSFLDGLLPMSLLAALTLIALIAYLRSQSNDS